MRQQHTGALCAVLAAGALTLAGPAAAESKIRFRQEQRPRQQEWCQTEVRWRAKEADRLAAGSGCATRGSCDVPAVRDGWIPGPSDPILTLCLNVVVLAYDNGSGAAATQGDVDSQILQLNADYLPYGIQFMASTQFVNNSLYRDLQPADEAAMKTLYSSSPATQLNVFVVNVLGGYAGVGTFPWDPDALTAQGGIIMDNNYFGGGQSTLTHEVGHCLGLWHTHHGVSEVPLCSACFERADGLNGDTTGDFCADTPSTPVNYGCFDPPGNDTCSNTPWGSTDPMNYMGYAGTGCWSHYTTQQSARQHCWVDDVLTGWLCDAVGACCVSGTCTIDTEANCLIQVGTYLGDTSDCVEPLQNPTTHTSGPISLAVPDNGYPTNGAAHTINVGASHTLGDVDIGLTLLHTFLGDVVITIEHLGTVVTVVDRPGGIGGSGCVNDNYNGIVLDDEGTGGAIENQCVFSLTSPPGYRPNQPLSLFDGLSAAGAWTITVYDAANLDTGTLESWTLVLDGVAQDPCTPCAVDGDCDDGNACNGVETCGGNGLCEDGVPLACDDGNACTSDNCNPATGLCEHPAVNCNDYSACTTDSCNPSTGCIHAPIDCSDNDACTFDLCDVINGCFNFPFTCDDSDACTQDSCDSLSGCQFDPIVPCCGNGTCDDTEDCATCAADCPSAMSTASCGNGVCEPWGGEDCLSCGSDCNGKQNGNPNRQFCCGDGAGVNPVNCLDARCSADGYACTSTATQLYCCGDGTCENAEDNINCAVDCDDSCATAADCNDADACTIDACVTGQCVNTPVDCSDGNVCTADVCSAGVCSNPPADCNDSDPCTTDTCIPGTGCVNASPSCGPADGCCPPGCSADPDCCVPRNGSCQFNSECCSGVCKNNGRCR